MATTQRGTELDVTGATVRVMAASDETAGAYAMIEQIDRPGAGSPPHANTREDIVITVIEGTVEMALPNETVELAAGHSVSVPRGTRHWTRNTGAGPSKVLFTFVPGGFERFFVDVAALGPSPDLDRIAAIAAGYGMELAPPEEGRA